MHSTVFWGWMLGHWLRLTCAHCRHGETSPATHPPFQNYSLPPSIHLSPPTLIMALGPSEWPTEVNAPQRREAIVYEAVVEMSRWNRQIKEKRDEVDAWWECLKCDWHMREKEREREKTWVLQFESAMIFFFAWFLILLTLAFHPGYSLFWSLLLKKLLSILTFKCTDAWKW